MYFHCYNSNIHLKILPDLAQSCLFILVPILFTTSLQKELILKIFLMFEDEQRFFVFFSLILPAK